MICLGPGCFHLYRHGRVPINKIIIVRQKVHGIHLIKLRGEVAPGVGDHVPPLGVLPPGHGADDPGHEAVQRVVVTTDH